MRTVIKLLIAALVLNGTYRLGVVYWEHYEFEDAVQKAIQFSQNATPEELTSAIVELADEREIPLDPGGLTVTRKQRQVIVDAAYERTVEIAPRVPRVVEFDVHVSVLMVN